MKIAMLSRFPPQQDGIAIYTQRLIIALSPKSINHSAGCSASGTMINVSAYG